MVLRLILRLLANNEELVRRLSDSYPIRSAARVVAMAFQKTKNAIEDSDISAESIKNRARRFSDTFKNEFNQAKEEFKKRK